MFSLALFGPHIQGCALTSLDASEHLTALIAQVLLIQEGTHTRIVQTRRACHANAPLGLHAHPALPGTNAVRPEVDNHLGRLLLVHAKLSKGRSPGVVGIGELVLLGIARLS